MNLQINSAYDLIIIVSIISIFVLYFSYRYNYFFPGTSVLITFRALILVLLILLILNPVIEKKGNNKISLPWRIYVDESLSIKYHKQPSAVAYKKGIQKFLKKIKDNKINFEAFYFGSRIDYITEISNMGLDANSTNLGLIFNKLIVIINRILVD